MLDQRRLPQEEEYLRLTGVEEVAVGIETLAVRGAPAIGDRGGLRRGAGGRRGRQDLEAATARLRRTRPTAVNLAWALDRMARVAGHDVASLAAEARAIHREDVAACRAMGRIGAEHVPDGATVLTHCNAGALATGGYGSALGVVRAAREQGKRVRVVACETRPVLQGARLTAWELARDGFDVTLITDSMVAQLMSRRGVALVVVGADRIARSGDVANKIGTYGVACLAGMPTTCPSTWRRRGARSTWPARTALSIPIEQRDPREVLTLGDRPRGARPRPRQGRGAPTTRPST